MQRVCGMHIRSILVHLYKYMWVKWWWLWFSLTHEHLHCHGMFKRLPFHQTVVLTVPKECATLLRPHQQRLWSCIFLAGTVAERLWWLPWKAWQHQLHATGGKWLLHLLWLGLLFGTAGALPRLSQRCFYGIVSVTFASIAADNMARSWGLSLCRAAVVSSEQKSWCWLFYLVRRLQKEYPNRPDWKEIIGYHVEPVVIPAGGRASGLLKFFPSTVVSLIFGYLEGFPKAFYVKAESLRKLGFASAARGARKQASHYRGGYWAAIKTNPKLKVTASFYGKMVRVVGVHTRVHLANVSASLDLEPQLNAPLQSERTMRNPGGHVWHEAMIHHRCKMLTICDSACERYFSLLHSIFDEDRSLAPHRMANRLLLREASVSCLGGARDEALIDQLAEILMSQFGKKPLKRHSDGKSVSWKMQELAAQSNVKAQNKQLSLFGDANLGSYFQGMGPDALSAVQDLAKKHAPATLDPDSSERAKRARQDALPLFVEDQRTTRKARAPSTMQEKLNQWLQSNDGEGWLQSRRDLEPGSGSSRFQLFKLFPPFVRD